MNVARWYVTALIAGWLGVSAVAETLKFQFTFEAGDLGFSTFNGYDRVELPDAVFATEDVPGHPWLPARYVNILLPQHVRDVLVTASADEVLLATNMLVLPVQPPHPLSVPAPAFTPPDPAVYQTDAIMPMAVAVAGEAQKIRGNQFLPVRLNPVRYNPVRRELYLVRRIMVAVEYTVLRTSTAVAPSLPPAAVFDEITRNLVVNPERLTGAAVPVRKQADAQPAGALDYLIITSPALSNAFEQLARHRRTRDYLAVQVVTTNTIAAGYSGTRPDGGVDLQTKIRNCIKSNVVQKGTVYVVLGGDNTIVPVRGCYVTCSGYTENNMPTDLYYGGLDGTWDGNANGVYGETADSVDMAYDVIVARIPVRTAAQATDYINKLLRFESASVPAGFARKLFIGGMNLWNTYTGDARPSDLVGDGRSEFRSHSPVSDAEIWGRRIWRDGIKAYNSTTLFSQFHDTLTSWDGGTPGDYVQSAANMILRLNQGWNQVMFNTHGSYTSWSLESGGFTSSSAAALTNNTAIVYTMACLTGGFDAAEPSLSEAFVRNANGGALVYLGCSRYGWGSPGTYRGGPSMDYAYAFYNQLYNTKRTTAGIAFAEHKLSQIGSCGYNGAPRWIQFGLNLQGEPLAALFRPDNWLGNDPFYFRAIALTNNIMLRWPDPHTCGYTSKVAHVRFDTSNYPANTNDGSLLYQGYDQVYEHTGRTPGQPYYYTIWVSHDGEHFIEPE